MRVGDFELEGPRLGQSLECTRGRECSLVVDGERLQQGEALMVLMACGTASAQKPTPFGQC